MGMGVSSATSAVSGAGMWQQQRSSFNQLSSALTSGNLDAAKQAFASLSANKPAATDPNSPLGKLGAALRSGDVNAAQQAFSALRSGHHHHGSGTPPATASSPLATSGTVGTNINTTA